MLNVQIYRLTSKVTQLSSFKNEKFLLTQLFSVLFKQTRDYRDQSMYWHQWHKISQLTLVRAKPERQRWRGCQIYCQKPACTVEQKRSAELRLYFWMISIKRKKIYDICVMSQRYSHCMGRYFNQLSSRGCEKLFYAKVPILHDRLPIFNSS